MAPMANQQLTAAPTMKPDATKTGSRQLHAISQCRPATATGNNNMQKRDPVSWKAFSAATHNGHHAEPQGPTRRTRAPRDQHKAMAKRGRKGGRGYVHVEVECVEDGPVRVEGGQGLAVRIACPNGAVGHVPKERDVLDTMKGQQPRL
jgi:hypothetical protein